MEKVYIRLESKRITLNSKKCEFGQSSIEFVGHTIDATGIAFSKEKIQEVVTFRMPKNQKDLKSFFGLRELLQRSYLELFRVGPPAKSVM